jgi:hypothetical protein
MIMGELATKASITHGAAGFPWPADHPNREAHRWLDTVLGGLDLERPGKQLWNAWEDASIRSKVGAQLDEQAPAFRIDILKACLERTAWHRAQYVRSEWRFPGYAAASVLHGIACTLYTRRLPYAEGDLCDVLRLSRHGCGHGCDVKPPFELALAHARKHGLTPDLLAGMKIYVDALAGVGSTTAWQIKRRGALLFLLDPDPAPRRKSCWSDRFRTRLASMPPEAQSHWQRLVLEMNVNDFYTLPLQWRKKAEPFVADLGAARVLDRLADWWPDPCENTTWPIQPAGSQLLKYFIWLLETMPDDPPVRQRCDALVVQLSELDWNPRQTAAKAMVVAAHYLVGRPPEVGWPALQRLAAWSALVPRDPGWTGDGTDRIDELARSYAEGHGIAASGRAR